MERDDLNLIIDGLERILADAPLEVIDREGGVGADADALWAVLSENGYPRLAAAPEHQGFGASIADLCEIAKVSARHALAAPLADSALATALLSASGITAPDIRIAIPDPSDPEAALPHGAQAQAMLTLGEGALHLLEIDAQALKPVRGGEDGAATLIGLPNTVIAEASAPNWLTEEAFTALAALMRAAQMAGSMQAVLDLTLAYTSEREQFGRPLSKFQAIQHHLADIACEAAASAAAVELAADALRADPSCGAQALQDIAIAKIRCGEAAARVAAAAHQAHGAMGFTREYALGRYTRRLWQWQDEFGSEAVWAAWLGAAVFAQETPSLWPRMTDTHEEN